MIVIVSRMCIDTVHAVKILACMEKCRRVQGSPTHLWSIDTSVQFWLNCHPSVHPDEDKDMQGKIGTLNICEVNGKEEVFYM